MTDAVETVAGDPGIRVGVFAALMDNLSIVWNLNSSRKVNGIASSGLCRKPSPVHLNQSPNERTSMMKKNDNVGISWTQAVLNSLAGCKKCSVGCANCYALRNLIRFANNPVLNKDGRYSDLVKTITRETVSVLSSVPVKDFTGNILFNPGRLYSALRFTEPLFVFTDEFSDLYHANVGMDIILEHHRVFHTVPHCIFQILTKRADRLKEVDKAVRAELGQWPANIWQGVSICAPSEVELSRIDKLGATGAVLKWISAEPWISEPARPLREACPDLADRLQVNGIEWVVIGGESGSKKITRLMTLDDARYWIEAGRKAGCKVHFKQLGTQLAIELGVYSTRGKGEHRAKGGNFDQMPKDLRVREWPAIPEQPVVQPKNFQRAFGSRKWMLL
jgi:protein gp37